MANSRQSSIGLGVDASGGPVVDPTQNVLALVAAAVTRLDDLRVSDMKRLEDLQNAEARRVDEIAKLRAEYQEKLTLAESKRIDAIRAVDVGAVAIASERAAQQASVLANQVAASAETLRSLVASTAQTVAASLAAVSGQLIERISALEKTSYVGSGRSAISDPMIAELVNEMRSLRESRDVGAGKTAGSSAIWGYVAGGLGLVFMLIGTALTLIHLLKP